MTQIISVLLLVGVATSAAILIFGLALLVLTGETGYQTALSPGLLYGSPGSTAFPTSIGDILRGAGELKPFAIIELGVLVLIATPVLRVMASVVLFLLEHDYLYTVITLVVLLLLFASLFWIR